MLVYYLCEFEYGYTGQFYQEVQDGYVIRLLDLTGNVLNTEGSYGYYLLDKEPVTPTWV
jgi:hypothetical protein